MTRMVPPSTSSQLRGHLAREVAGARRKLHDDVIDGTKLVEGYTGHHHSVTWKSFALFTLVDSPSSTRVNLGEDGRTSMSPGWSESRRLQGCPSGQVMARRRWTEAHRLARTTQSLTGTDGSATDRTNSTDAGQGVASGRPAAVLKDRSVPCAELACLQGS